MLVTHDMGVIAETADRVAVMYAGRLVEIGPVEEVLRAPRHPYTRGLMASIPSARAPCRAAEPDRRLDATARTRSRRAAPSIRAAAGPDRVAVQERPELTPVGAGASACWLNAGGVRMTDVPDAPALTV